MSIKSFFVVLEELSELLTIETNLGDDLESINKNMRASQDIKTALSHQKTIIKEITALVDHYESHRKP